MPHRLHSRHAHHRHWESKSNTRQWFSIGLGVLLGVTMTIISLQASNALKNHQPVTSATPELTIGGDVQYPVVYVVDGDTIDVEMGGQPTRVRLIGVDTPELADPRRHTECFAKEASLFTTEILQDQEVRLELDPSQNARDGFGRILAYVFTADGQNFNQRLIKDGFGYEYTFEEKPYQYQRDFQLAERAAKEARRGVWSDTCIR